MNGANPTDFNKKADGMTSAKCARGQQNSLPKLIYSIRSRVDVNGRRREQILLVSLSQRWRIKNAYQSC